MKIYSQIEAKIRNYLRSGLVFVLLSGSSVLSIGAQTVSIAAAADLQYCLVDLNAKFLEKIPGIEIKVATGSSGNFASQIMHGAPFDLFLSADLSYPEQLIKGEFADRSTLWIYGLGKIVLWTKKQINLHDGLEILKDKNIARRIAIANPEHAPYGKAAKAALEKAGLWEAVKDRLVFGDNIAQTAQFVDTENADVGIVALSLVISPSLKGKGSYQEVDLSLYDPLEQAVVITKFGANNQAAHKYLDFLASTEARRIFDQYGFRKSK